MGYVKSEVRKGDLLPCCFVSTYERFRRTCFFQYQGRQETMEEVGSKEMSGHFHQNTRCHNRDVGQFAAQDLGICTCLYIYLFIYL
jgi:hypothetical protein